MILMDLLLQAAKVLELGDSDIGTDRVTPKSTRAAHFHQYAKSKGENSENSDGSLYGENGTSEEDSSSNQKKRVSGKSSLRGSTKRLETQSVRHPVQPLTSAGTREVHNQLEKNRRRQLRECFNHLQQCVPSLENKRVATQSILQGAIKHIKNLKKKDVEQEREIQMLANKKCELKKKYDLELNKCSEEQQRLADAFLKVMKAKHDNEEDDGQTSDSTTTASEGPEFSDDDRKTTQAAKTFVPSNKVEGSRKRKLGPRTAINFVSKSVESPVTSQPSAAAAAVVAVAPPTSITKSSTVSSSSLALKHMLEQRKKNQQTGAAQVKAVSPEKVQVLHPAAVVTKGPPKSVSSITSSYPMISTRLASGLKAATPVSSHTPLVSEAQPPPAPALQTSLTVSHTTSSSTNQVSGVATQVSHLIAQAPQTTGSLNILANTSMAGQSLLLKTVPMATPPVSKRRKISEICRSIACQPLTSAVMNLPPSLPHIVSTTDSAVTQQKSSVKAPKTAAILSAPVTLLQPTQSPAIRLSEMKKLENSQTTVSKILTAPINADLQGLNYLGKNIIGSNAGRINMQSLASLTQPVDGTLSSKLLSTVIPVSLASFIRNIPLNAVVPPVVSLATTQISMTTASVVSNTNTPSSTVASLLTNPMQQSLGSNLIFTTTNKTDVNSIPLSNNNARIATLLAAPSPHLNKNVIKPNSTLTLPSGTQHATVPSSSAQSSTITLQDNTLKTLTLTPTLLPLSISNGPLTSGSGSNISPATQLRFFTPFPASPVMATSLGNGQTVMPTVVQLGTSGQVALLQNLIPAQHVQVQGPRQHHLLSQPIVVMTSPGTNFNVTPAGGSNTSSAAPPSTNIL